MWANKGGWQGQGWGQPVAAAGGGAPTWTATGNPAGQNNGLTSVTFSAVAIGSPASADVIVAIYTSQGTVASSITCNGVAMTKRIEESTVASGLQIWSITAGSAGVAGSATTTFVASAGGGMGVEGLQVGKLTGVNATPTSTNASTATSIAVTVPATGFAIIGAYGGSATLTWTGATQDFATVGGTDTLWMARATATGTVSETGQLSIHMVSASWGP